MAFRKIDYLEWARAHMGRFKLDLAKSNIKAVTKKELGLTLDQIALMPTCEEGTLELREVIARRYGVPPAQVLPTSGATMAIFLACSALIRKGDEVVLESPAYEPLHRASVQAGARVKSIKRRFDRGFRIETGELERAVGRATRAVLMTNLHNPSGIATSPGTMAEIGRIARRRGATVISSEVYLDNAFTPGLKPAVNCGPGMVSIGSLSKVYGLGGLRIGWMVADEALIRKATDILAYIEHDLPAPSETIALAALRKSDLLVARCRAIVTRNLAIVAGWIRARGDVRWLEPEGGTVCMVKLPAGVEAKALSTLLREKYATLVVPGDFFGIQGFLRIACGTDEEILREGLKNVSKAIDLMKPRRS